jgi:D-alanine transaminase
MENTIIHYINGEWVAGNEASTSVFDRGHHFGDGVYEVIAYFNRRMVDGEPHLARLARSLEGVRITNPHEGAVWHKLLQELIDRNPFEHGGVYLQVTRGTAPRDHRFPANTSPNITAFCFPAKTPSQQVVGQGVRVITQEDIRWKGCDIKTINLLPNVLAKQAAQEAGAQDALLVKENGEVSECSIANFFAVFDGVLTTHPATREILGGITRWRVLELARAMNIPVAEQSFSLEKLLAEGQEAFLTSTTANLLPIVKVDDHKIGQGAPGPLSQQLLDAYLAHIEAETGHKVY